MSKEYSQYGEHGFVTLNYPHKDDAKYVEFGGVWQIVLHTGSRVWISSDYSMVGCEGIIQVGDGKTNGYDQHGGCIVSVPAEWCEYWTEEEAGKIVEMQRIDDEILGWAIG